MRGYSGQREIMTFTGRYAFLSNFYPCVVKVCFDGGMVEHYPHVEAAYQAVKSNDRQIRKTYQRIDVTGSECKKYAKAAKLLRRPDSLDVMECLLESKFSYPPLSRSLMNVTVPIVEGNWWGDIFWGVDEDTGEGENNLGKILSRIRDHLVLGNGICPVAHISRR